MRSGEPKEAKEPKEQRELRIKPVPDPPAKKKISFHLPEPTIERFNKYLEVFEEIYGRTPDQDFVADQIFTAFLDSDRGFMDHVKNSPNILGKKAEPGAAVETAT